MWEGSQKETRFNLPRREPNCFLWVRERDRGGTRGSRVEKGGTAGDGDGVDSRVKDDTISPPQEVTQGYVSGFGNSVLVTQPSRSIGPFEKGLDPRNSPFGPAEFGVFRRPKPGNQGSPRPNGMLPPQSPSQTPTSFCNTKSQKS